MLIIQYDESNLPSLALSAFLVKRKENRKEKNRGIYGRAIKSIKSAFFV